MSDTASIRHATTLGLDFDHIPKDYFLVPCSCLWFSSDALKSQQVAQ